jgi:hypothetical protein
VNGRLVFRDDANSAIVRAQRTASMLNGVSEDAPQIRLASHRTRDGAEFRVETWQGNFC